MIKMLIIISILAGSKTGGVSTAVTVIPFPTYKLCQDAARMNQLYKKPYVVVHYIILEAKKMFWRDIINVPSFSDWTE